MKSLMIGMVIVIMLLSLAPAPPSWALTVEEVAASEKVLEDYLLRDNLIEILKLYRECRSRCMFINQNMQHWECRRMCIVGGCNAAERELKR
jgi:hypothetical protein